MRHARFVGVGLVAALVIGAGRDVQAQNAVISGAVTSEDDRPVYGASVGIAELNIVVLTRADGRYNLVVPAGRVRDQAVTMQVRAFGYKHGTRQITLSAAEQTADFQLGLDPNMLEAVVVTGTVDATPLTQVPFAITRVDAANLPVVSVDPLTELKGKVPGVDIVSASGRPGAQPAVLLRGPKSINALGRSSQEPLYIVDGVPLSGGLPAINPQDIESVEIVRGAAGSTMYGARAGSGVIAITTRSAKTEDQVTFRFRSEGGVNDVERSIGLAQNHFLLLDERNQGFCESVTGQPVCPRTFDWIAEAARINNFAGADYALTPVAIPVQPISTMSPGVLRGAFQAKNWPVPTYNAVDQVVKPRPFTLNSIDMAGRFGQTAVFASASYLDQGGAIRFLNGYRRTSARLNIDQRVTDRLSVSLRSYYSRAISDGQNQETDNTAFFRLTRVPAAVNVLQTDTLGRLYIRPNLMASGQQNENPLYSLQNTKRDDVNDRYLGGLTVKYAPLDWLSFDANFGYDYSKSTFSEIQDKGYRATSLAFSPFFNPGSIFTGAQGSEGYSATASTLVRHEFGPDLVTRTTVGYTYYQEDTHFRRLQGVQLAVAGVESAANVTAQQDITSTFTSQRLVALTGGVNLEYKQRYIADGVVHRDGSSLFGSNNRWANYYRGSVAWRVAAEPFWPWSDQIDEFKLRASHGTTGGRPRFDAQYETYTIGTGGLLTAQTLGNSNLRPETNRETEVGADLELFRRIGMTVNYAYSRITDQIMPVPVAAATGFATQWRNAGTLENKTWELSLNIPIIQKSDVTWSTRFTYDRTRSTITQLNVNPFNYGAYKQATTNIFRAQVGERLGTFYGRKFLTSCSELPTSFQTDCGGPTSAFQKNDDGWLVWVGSGNTWRDGITKNLWQASLPGAQSPWPGVALNWGMPIISRAQNISGDVVPLGNALPDFRFSVAQDFRWKRLTVYALLDASIGQRVWNQGRHWAYLDFQSSDQDQRGKTVETAKPVGYYFRAAAPNSTGLGGLYDILAPNNNSVEDASYGKLREATVSYHVGPLGGVGDWDVSVIGRNLFTITSYKGFDPEVGIPGLAVGSNVNQAVSGAINAIDAFTFPNLRTVTFAVSSRF